MTTTTDEILALAREIASSWDWMTEVDQPEPNRLNIRLTKLDDLIPIVTMLRVKRLGYLAAITGLDQGVEEETLEVLYHFCAAAAILTVRVHLSRKKAIIPTLSEIIPSAEPFERELSEMFGVTISGLDAPEHLYLPDDWPAATYPLRKDFDEEVLQSTDAQQAPVDQSPTSNLQEVNDGE